MSNQLKSDYLNTIFHFKNLINTTFGRDKDHLLSLTDLLILQGIGDHQSASVISHNLTVTKGAISQSINSLTKRGYVERAIDPDNRRNMLLSLTDDGQTALKSTNQEFDQAFEKFVTEMGEQDLVTLLRLMKQMTGILTD